MSKCPNPTVYQRLILRIAGGLPPKLRCIFLHPAGPTTIFFWAPTLKWGLVLAGIDDFKRTAETISLPQTASLVFSGAVWSRYAYVINPRNYNLLGVNAFICGTSAFNFMKGLIFQIQEKVSRRD